MKQKNLFIFGTRPEAIKMAPVILTFKSYPELFDIKVCVTAQHRQMLDQVLSFFEITPDYDLNLMKENQSLYSLTSEIILGLKPVLEDYKPDHVFVHGDTTTSMVASLAAFYNKSKICHIEAGLRTGDKYSPYPEEINRLLTGRLADVHFAPTETSRINLLNEGICDSKIVVTGNTVIDALLSGVKKVSNSNHEEIVRLREIIRPDSKIILVTGHRRENFGDGFNSICKALGKLAKLYGDKIDIIYPVHLNPNVKKTVFELLSNYRNVHLINPLDYEPFIWLMQQSFLILTDSGGVQEEAPSLGKPVLVMRNTTERPEAVSAGTVKLVGTDSDLIINEVCNLLDNEILYKDMSTRHNPYGDGTASKRIINYFLKNK
jgi:UDP-N-acetylglucosamine 2-epimerase (non-hydrolysing)